MVAFVPSTSLNAISGTRLASNDALTPLRSNPPKTARSAPARMSAYPYTGSGYGAAGVPYGADQFGQSFKQTSTKDIVETAASVPIFKTLVSLLQETGFDYELSKGGPFTVFAPTDSAFASLLEPHGFAVLGPLLRPENREELKKVLAYHVVPGAITASSIIANGQFTVTTFAGVPITVMGYGKRVTAGSANVIKGDVPCTNGIIHAISSVLIPSSFNPQPAGPVKKEFPSTTIVDTYTNTLTPRQALGIDPLPAGYEGGALSSYN